jgi:hypothetical protein
MKKLVITTLSLFLLFGCSNRVSGDNTNSDTDKTNESQKVQTPSPAASDKDLTFTFKKDEPGKIPNGWSQYFTGKGEATDWKVVDENGDKVLAQLSEDNPNYHFNVIVYDEFYAKNVYLSVRMKGVAGKMDRGGGFVWRFIDADNYYVVRANPLEDNVVLYKVVNGKRTDLPLVGKGKTYGTEVDPLGHDWNTLTLTVKDDLFTVFLNDKELFKVRDDTFSQSGKVGLWTKADAVTYFDDFKIRGSK